MKLRTILLIPIILLLVYFIGTSLTGFSVISQSCCTGDDCNEESKCSFAQPQIPPQNTINIILEILTIALIITYVFINLQQKKKN